MRDERGAIAIIVAAVTVALIGVLMIVADVGMLYQQRRQLQTAVDSAALGGAMELAEGRGQSDAQAVVNRYVSDNGGPSTPAVTVTFPSPTSVHVAADVDRDLFFARLFGRTNADVAASATADYGLATAVRNLVPIIVPEQSVPGHIGLGNTATFEFGDDRPVDPFNKTATVNGSTVTYRIQFIDDTGGTVDVSVRDPLPSNLTYVAGSADQGGTYTSGDRTVRWTLTGIPNGDGRTVTFSATTSNGRTDNTAYADVSGEHRTRSASVGGSTPQQGYFWLVDFDAGSGGVPQYEDWIRNGYPEEVEIGFLANGTGMKASLRDAVEWRMANHPKVILPLFDYTRESGHGGAYHVIGFAEFVITGVNFQGNPKGMTGYFTTGTVAAGSSGAGTPPDHGVTAIWLSE